MGKFLLAKFLYVFCLVVSSAYYRLDLLRGDFTRSAHLYGFLQVQGFFSQESHLVTLIL